jgi:23S rRNA pseudouridine2605 synthase
MDEKPSGHNGGERVAKVIARAGLASRRDAEAWVAAGRVAVNGETIRSPARNVTLRDRITVDGEALPARERTRLFLYHKLRGLMTTHADPQGRPTIFSRLPRTLPRLISIGRLDFNTEGLLLLTNDGALARVLELPATGWLRRYRVRAHGAVTQSQLDTLKHGITISGIHYGAIEAVLDRMQGSNLWLTLGFREGKNREVRNVLEHLGLTVNRLIRVSFGPFQLGEVAEGAVEEVPTRVLREQLGERLIAQSGADFSTPVVARTAKQTGPRDKNWKPAGHAWQSRNDETPKPLRRKFHGARRDGEKSHEQPAKNVREAVVTDRKGRRVAVVRHGHAKPPEHRPETQEASAPKRARFGRGRRGGADRASGPRPSRPRRR